jgi:peroxiredoxin
MSPDIGATVQPFTLPQATGGWWALQPGDHAATVVVFTANHCPYALAWHDRLQDVARDYADHGVSVVQINPNDATKHPSDSTEASAARVARGEFAGPYLRDEGQDVARGWGAQRTPDVFVVDRAGVLVYRGAPDGDHDDPTQAAGYVRAALDDVLAGRRVALARTEPVGCTVKWAQPGALGLTPR